MSLLLWDLAIIPEELDLSFFKARFDNVQGHSPGGEYHARYIHILEMMTLSLDILGPTFLY
jgi:hypothetical protein